MNQNKLLSFLLSLLLVLISNLAQAQYAAPGIGSPENQQWSFEWIGFQAQVQTNEKYSSRFPISSDLNALKDAAGTAKEREVKDHLLNILQPMSVAFTAPDTVCVNTPVTISNVTNGASSYYWNFCTANLNTLPTGQNLGNVSNSFTLPVFMDYVAYNNNYYGFLVNYSSGRLIRLDFGNSLLNAPSAVNLGNFGGIIPAGIGAEGIQMVFNNGRWYAIIVGGYTPSGSAPRILKIDFGADLTNTNPTATNWGNIGNMLQPIDLHVFKEGNNWYGLTVNAENNTITRFSFTDSFNNTPTAVNLGNLGNLSYPTGIYAINDNGFWRVFIVNAGDNTRSSGTYSLTRLDFGNSLLNTPVGINLGNPGGRLQHPRDLTILKMCDQIIGFAVNGHFNNSDIVRLDFNNNLSSVPTLTSLGVIGNSSFPHSISKLFRVNDDVYAFITNVDNNSLTRLRFSGCTNASSASSDLQNPPAITYDKPGTYNINLTVDDGLPTQQSFCKQIVVVQTKKSPLQQKSFCAGDSVLLTSSNLSGNQWNTGSSSNSIVVKTPGTYWARSSEGGCISIDSFLVSVKPTPSVNIGNDTSLCVTDSIVLDAGNTGADYLWQNGQRTQQFTVHKAGLYHVTAFKDGCIGHDSLMITGLSSPQINITGNTIICRNGKTDLTASGGSVYLWSPATGLSNPNSASTIASPETTTEYYVSVTNQNGCKTKDSITISVSPKPVFSVASSKDVLCVGDTAKLIASGGDTYMWLPPSTLSSPFSNTTVAYPLTSTVYEVIIGESRCGTRDTLRINLPVVDKPIVSTTKSNDINCFIGQAYLSAGGGANYLWKPSTGLSDSTIKNPTVSISATITYHVFIKTADGCQVEDSITVNVLKGNDGSGFPVPSAFTPNGDGKNDCFGVRYWGDVKDFSMSLYNRWGELIFHTKNPNQCWDGKYKGQLQPTDVFVYLIKAKTLCGDIFRKGTFALIK